MAAVPKYAKVERERRFLVRSVPPGIRESRVIVDRYLTGTRLRLREVTHADGSVERKLGHKVRLGPGPEAVAHTSLYLDAAEWEVLARLPATVLRKTRHDIDHEGYRFAVDELSGGALLAELDAGPEPARPVPPWLDVVREVTADEAWTGAGIAARSADQRPGPDR